LLLSKSGNVSFLEFSQNRVFLPRSFCPFRCFLASPLLFMFAWLPSSPSLPRNLSSPLMSWGSMFFFFFASLGLGVLRLCVPFFPAYLSEHQQLHFLSPPPPPPPPPTTSLRSARLAVLCLRRYKMVLLQQQRPHCSFFFVESSLFLRPVVAVIVWL